MNKLKLFIGVGVCGVLFSGCWFFGFDDNTKTTQESKVEICDKMPEELETQLDKLVEKYKDNDWLYDKPIQEKSIGKNISQAKDMLMINEML